ncbi:hypothetical protein XaCFBP7622_12510 [Xanthomonas arboricola]|nr:hypothetical protein XaCFBP7622_12510 [Xanthomonas arboricola]
MGTARTALLTLVALMQRLHATSVLAVVRPRRQRAPGRCAEVRVRASGQAGEVSLLMPRGDAFVIARADTPVRRPLIRPAGTFSRREKEHNAVQAACRIFCNAHP